MSGDEKIDDSSLIARNVYAAVGVNSSPHCVAWSEAGLIYGAANAVAFVDNLRTDRVRTFAAHSGRVNAVRWGSNDMFVSASTDNSVIVWTRDKADEFAVAAVLSGHQDAVTVVDVSVCDDCWLVASSSVDGSVRLWRVTSGADGNTVDTEQVLSLGRGLALDVRLFRLPNCAALAMAVALDDSSVRLFARDEAASDMLQVQVLRGHDDWVGCIDATTDCNGDVLLATASQDTFIRVWRMSPRLESKEISIGRSVKGLVEDADIRVKEDLFSAQDMFFAVSLETVLAGHEDKVTGVHWQRRSATDSPLALLSCSMDKSMLVWTPDEEQDGLWTEAVRVGEVGGNTLGFLGCQFGEEGSTLLGYSFNGALRIWAKSDRGEWLSAVTPGGHAAAVVDIDWERSGRYLLSASSDQTTRVHAAWRKGERVQWHEVARPQVHGHDMTCLTALSGHRLASAGEEKIVRTFEATKMFVDNLAAICGEAIPEAEKRQLAQGASVPSLGLSNKAVFEQEKPSVPAEEKHVKDVYPEYYFTPVRYERPPPEDALAQNTLWPELHKLYGHGNELFCVCSSWKSELVASACKATKPEQAQIILWDAKTWKIAQRLSGHALTVTQMEFSPCDRYLLSVSRDRTWCLFERDHNELFTLVAKTDKKTAVHQRLLWSCSWSADSRFFATSSRDGLVAVWTRTQEASVEGGFGLACKSPLKLEDSVTAVAFCRTAISGSAEATSCLLAAGLESGKVCLLRFNHQMTPEWAVLLSLDVSSAHHMTIKRIRFRNYKEESDQEVLMATCSADHAVKIYAISMNAIRHREGKALL